MTTWSTEGVTTAERYDFWRDALTAAFTPLVPHAIDHDGWRHGAPLDGRVVGSAVDRLNITRIRTCAQRNLHGEREVRASPDEVWFANLLIAGRCVGEQDGRQCDLQPGSLALFDARKPFSLNYIEDWSAISIRVPSADMVDLTGHRGGSTAVALATDRGAGAMLRELMVTMARSPSDIRSSNDITVAEAFLLLLGSVLPGREVFRTPVPELDALLRERVRAHIHSAVLDGPVRPEEVAARFHISVRKLHQLFGGADLSFGRTVMAARVDGCANELAQGSSSTLTDLAARWGFSDLSHMHRGFRRHRGRSPAEFRSGETGFERE